jgi:hypothetical protein
VELLVKKHWKGSEDCGEGGGNKPLPEAQQVVDHPAHFLSQRAAFKSELPYLAGGGADQIAAAEG